MVFKNALAMAAALSAILSATAYADSNSIDDVFAGGLECMHTLNEQSLAAQATRGNGEIRLYSVPYAHTVAVRVDDSYSQNANIQYIPAIETTYLDGDVPGSAWRTCMQEKGLPVPDPSP